MSWYCPYLLIIYYLDTFLPMAFPGWQATSLVMKAHFTFRPITLPPCGDDRSFLFRMPSSAFLSVRNTLLFTAVSALLGKFIILVRMFMNVIPVEFW